MLVAAKQEEKAIEIEKTIKRIIFKPWVKNLDTKHKF